MTTTPIRPAEGPSLDLEELLTHALRAKDMLAGACALLSRPAPLASTACHTVMEARAELASVVTALESLAARKAEAERAERLQREGAVRAGGGAR